MTLDESIKIFEAAAEDCLNIDEEQIGILYADDTECIENYKASCIQCSKDSQQIAEWLKDYKRLKEQEPNTEVLDKIRAEMIEIQLLGYATVDGKRKIASRAVLQIIDKYRAEAYDRQT